MKKRKPRIEPPRTASRSMLVESPACDASKNLDPQIRAATPAQRPSMLSIRLNAFCAMAFDALLLVEMPGELSIDLLNV